MHRAVAIGFDHMHMGDQLSVAAAHPGVQLVGALDADRDRMTAVCQAVGLGDLPAIAVDGDGAGAVAAALDLWSPDLAIVCSTTAAHRSWVELLAARGVHVLLEKPFAPDLADADAMAAAARQHGTALAVNWPLAWYPSHRTARRLIADGRIGEVTEIHFYDGNRGPLFHLHNKIETQPSEAQKAASWWYSKAAGGGSMLDYLGYGTTLGTWFRSGELPVSVTAVTAGAPSLEVDEQSVVIAAYRSGLSTYQTRWGMFTDPWNHLTQPRTGFVLVGTDGTISSFDYDRHVTLQDAEHKDGMSVAVDTLAPEVSTGLAALVHHVDTGAELDAPVSVEVGRTGQLMVDAAVASARLRRQVDVTVEGELDL